jgi:two-component system NtrC family sensor kinase
LSLWRKILPPFWNLPPGEDSEGMDYRRIWQRGLLGASLITLSPVAIMALNCYLKEGRLSGNAIWLISVMVPLLLVAVYAGTRQQVNRLYQLDVHRSNILREIVYTHKMAAIGRLASGVAHEINNPMAILREKAGLIQDLVLKNGGQADPDRVLELIGGILEASRRASSITHRLLNFGNHLQAGAEEIELGRVVRDVVGLFNEKAKFRGIRIALEDDGESPLIESDRSLLEQLLFNLLDNAFSAVEDGGFVRVGLTGPWDGIITLEVEDNGPGIAEDDLLHIFEPFFSTGGVRNSGLGLSITYGIVHRLGGKIKAESLAGQGAKFTVSLPLSHNPEQPLGSEDEITERALHAKGGGD